MFEESKARAKRQALEEIGDVLDRLVADRRVVDLGEGSEKLARRLIAARHARQAALGDGDHVAEAAWLMLLDLFAAKQNRYRICVSSACIASGAASSTALRWLAALERRGWIARTADHEDARRTFVALTHEGEARVAAALNAFWHALTVRPDWGHQRGGRDAPNR